MKRFKRPEWWRSKMPTRGHLERHSFFKRFAPYFADNGLWHLSRRSVSLGVAIGIFFGFLIPAPQMPFVVLFAIFFRANIPIGLATTFISNPFTFPVIYYSAYKLGLRIMGDIKSKVPEHIVTNTPDTLLGGEEGRNIFSGVLDVCSNLFEFFSQMGLPLVYGLLILATVGSILSYIIINFSWIFIITQKRKKRLQNNSLEREDKAPADYPIEK